MNILLMDDNEADRCIMQEAFKTLYPQDQVMLAADGVDGLQQLKQNSASSSAVDLVILDIGLPKKDGFEVLREMKRDIRLKEIPVVVLTGSLWDEDHQKAQELEADACFVKPATYTELLRTLQSIKEDILHKP